MLKQHTITNPIRTTGIGLHSGRKVTLNLIPAPINSGILFRRTDISFSRDIVAHANLVTETHLATVLQKEKIRIATVEHLLSSCSGLGIDNLIIELDCEEVPIMDGSAASFIFLIKSAGIKEQNAARSFLVIKKAIEIKHDNKIARLEPYHGFRLDFTIDFQHPAVDKTEQRHILEFSYKTYVKEIGRARTFGFAHEVESLRELGLARGGSLDNAIVLDEYRILNNEELRYEDEFVRHKILDAIGDLYLAGNPIVGTYIAKKSGHALNNALLRAMLSNPETFEKKTFSIENAPKSYLPKISHF